MAGKKPGPLKRPSALENALGNPGHRKGNEGEVFPDMLESFDPPDHLDEDAQQVWLELVPHLYKWKLLTTLDVWALAAGCEFEGLARRCRREAKDATLVIVLLNGTRQPNPIFGMALKYKESAMKIWREFGMTPSSRTGIDTRNPFGSDGKNEQQELLNPVIQLKRIGGRGNA